MKNFLVKNKKEILILLGIFIIFLCLRLPALHLPYHQDEFKTAISVEQGGEASGSMFAHPPLTQIIYRLSYAVLGGANLRFYPIFFSSLSFFLMYFLLRKREGKNVAYIGIALFSICFYSIWSSLMLDTDGAIVPFFFLCSMWAYDSFIHTTAKNKKYIWFGLLILSLLLGFLVKLSFIIVIGTVIADYIWNNKDKISKKNIIYGIVSLGVFGVLAVISLLFIHSIYPAFEIGNMIEHAKSFIHLGGRDYIQIIVQGVKAIFYSSPLLILSLLFVNKELFIKKKIYFIYLTFGFIFYFILFDFSRGALDKYLMFIIVPIIMIVAPIFSKILSEKYNKNKAVSTGVFFGVILLSLNFISQAILPLYPKTFWFSQVLHLHWAFLNPFIGGSGPIGFYISFIFIAVSFIFTAIYVFFYFTKKPWRNETLVILVIIGLVYNGVFAEELLFGKINGNSGIVLRDTLEYIQKSDSIKSVITYNDSGAYELTKMGKYAGRFYALPILESVHKERFEKHNGYFLVVNIPKINEDSFYAQYFAKCDNVYLSNSGRITANIYDCKK